MYEELIAKLRDHNACISIKTLDEAADAIENMSGKMKLYSFIWQNLPKSELDTLITMYRKQGDEE